MLQHEAWLRRLARSLVMDDTRADDVVQQVWLKALESRPNEQRDLRPWLKAVARNVAFNLHRSDIRRSRREKDCSREETLAERAFFEEDETRKLLLTAVKQIKEPYRSTLMLHYYEEMSLEDIARRLRIPGATVRTRLRRALDMIRTVLDERYGDRQSWGMLLFPVCWKGADLSWSSGAALASHAKTAGSAKIFAAKSLWGVAAAVIVAPVVITLGLTAPAAGPEASPAPSSAFSASTPTATQAPASPAPPSRDSRRRSAIPGSSPNEKADSQGGDPAKPSQNSGVSGSENVQQPSAVADTADRSEN